MTSFNLFSPSFTLSISVSYTPAVFRWFGLEKGVQVEIIHLPVLQAWNPSLLYLHFPHAAPPYKCSSLLVVVFQRTQVLSLSLFIVVSRSRSLPISWIFITSLLTAWSTWHYQFSGSPAVSLHIDELFNFSFKFLLFLFTPIILKIFSFILLFEYFFAFLIFYSLHFY